MKPEKKAGARPRRAHHAKEFGFDLQDGIIEVRKNESHRRSLSSWNHMIRFTKIDMVVTWRIDYRGCKGEEGRVVGSHLGYLPFVFLDPFSILTHPALIPGG